VDLDQVRAFLAITRDGGFARASESLHLSQPAISRRIHLLEHELGAPLFDRLGRRVALTDAGRAFLPHAQALLASLQDAINAVDAIRGADHGTVTLAVVGSLADGRLMSLLREHRRVHPGVDLKLCTALSPEVSALVLRAEAALGLRYGTDPSPGLDCAVVSQERLVAVCPPGHPLARGGADPSTALAGERWLGFPARDGVPAEPYAAAQAQLLAAHGLGAIETVPVDSLTAQKRMVEAGFGLAVLPETSIAEELRTGTLCAIAAPALTSTIPVTLIRRRSAFRSGAAQALWTAIVRATA
jgi:DNA-binding transcriptional LysR family regulator